MAAPITSTQDRIVTGLGLAAGPLLIAGILVALKKPKASAIVAGLGVVGGVLGAVAPQWFMPPPGPSPLASRSGWAEGLPSWSGILAKVTNDSALQTEDNTGLLAQGGYAYSDEAFTYNTALPAQPSRGGVLDSGQKLSGVGGFWVPR